MTLTASRIVVIGASGRIGSRLLPVLAEAGHVVVPASRAHGVDAVTGAGLEQAFAGADILIDVSNAPVLEGDAALAYFGAAGVNLTAAAGAAGIRHHIVLSIVGTDGLLDSRYFQAKKLQEDLVQASSTPFTVLRSTQFFEFIAGVVQNGTSMDVSLSPALVQPVAAEDIALALAELAGGPARNRIVEIAGPHVFAFHEVGREVLTAYEDPRKITMEPREPYFGAELGERSLMPSSEARIGALGFEDWLRQTLQPPARSKVRSTSGAGALL